MNLSQLKGCNSKEGSRLLNLENAAVSTVVNSQRPSCGTEQCLRMS